MDRTTAEALFFVALVQRKPHTAGQMVIDHVGTDRQVEITKNLKTYREALLHTQHRHELDALISAFEVK